MANIEISNLHPAGSNLFSDSESYMMDLSEDELNTTSGGFVTPFSTPITVVLGVAHNATKVAALVKPGENRRDDRGPVSWVP
ncbi:MAG: hypothetical protein N4J56_006589 [Chroococcidiopsis sp. SAG 2025]|uniref:hypothetical protein n=1 Tax=Chroococcidiopsis sp. SAG 2025 TaxID=171389 RepID=UPI0029371E98|nr:hypothetical protein [Chroococcidiopsis sp. SAG 2025]MDV2996884.1 hypothetical protein [Chroococcidiopsis sp. SAG 2025]